MKSTRKMAIIGLTAAIYTVLTVSIPFLAAGPVQLRISEAMNLLAFFNPVFGPGIILGCFVSNMFIGNGAIDMVMGTFATACHIFFITKSKKLFVASLWPTVFSFIIGLELTIISGAPSIFTFVTLTMSVMAGEFLAVSVLGYGLFRYLMAKNPSFIEFLRGCSKSRF